MTADGPDPEYAYSPESFDLKAICLNSNFGSLKFEDSYPKLQRIKEKILELEALNYREHLTEGESGKIENISRELIEQHIAPRENFDIGVGNSQQTHDQLETTADNFYESSLTKLRPFITYLRQEQQTDKEAQKELQDSIKNAKKLETELQVRLEEVSTRLEKMQKQIEKDKASVEKGKGITSAKFLSKEFERQSNTHNTEAKKWHERIWYFCIGLVFTAVGGFLLHYFVIKPTEDELLMIEFGIMMLLIISVEFYGLSFVAKNYNVEKNLETTNTHRRNVAETVISLLGSGLSQDESIKQTFLSEASKAIFEKETTGYLSKDQIVSTPVQELVTQVINKGAHSS